MDRKVTNLYTAYYTDDDNDLLNREDRVIAISLVPFTCQLVHITVPLHAETCSVFGFRTTSKDWDSPEIV